MVSVYTILSQTTFVIDLEGYKKFCRDIESLLVLVTASPETELTRNNHC